MDGLDAEKSSMRRALQIVAIILLLLAVLLIFREGEEFEDSSVLRNNSRNTGEVPSLPEEGSSALKPTKSTRKTGVQSSSLELGRGDVETAVSVFGSLVVQTRGYEPKPGALAFIEGGGGADMHHLRVTAADGTRCIMDVVDPIGRGIREGDTIVFIEKLQK